MSRRELFTSAVFGPMLPSEKAAGSKDPEELLHISVRLLSAGDPADRNARFFAVCLCYISLIFFN